MNGGYQTPNYPAANGRGLKTILVSDTNTLDRNEINNLYGTLFDLIKILVLGSPSKLPGQMRQCYIVE
jgi:hypothetical protein